MNTQLQKINPNGIPSAPLEAVAFWDLMASQFARGSVASQIMCGFALLELRTELGVKNGVPTNLPKPFGSWSEFIEKKFCFSDDTARNRIKMAEGVKAKFKKLELGERFKALLQTHPSQWSDGDTKLLSDALHKATDGMSQTDFLEKLGIAKMKSGNPDAHGHGRPAKNLTADEQLQLQRDMAAEDFLGAAKLIRASNRNFIFLDFKDDLLISAQISELEFALALRQKFLKTPRSRRVDVISEIIQAVDDHEKI